MNLYSVVNTPERETPPSECPAARKARKAEWLVFDGVDATSVLALDGRHGQPHLFAYGARKKAADRMRLPTGGFHQLLGGYPARAVEQSQDLGGLAGAFFGRLAFLGDLLLAGATLAGRGARLAFLLALAGSPVAGAGAAAISSIIICFLLYWR